MNRLSRWLPLFWVLLLIGVLRLVMDPIGSGLARFQIVGGVVVLWLGLLYFSRRRRWLFGIAVAVVALPGVFLLLPGRKPAVEILRASYLKNLQHYSGTPYVWGGENRRGIDCSGLVRQGLIDADLEIGLKTLNPHLLRRAISMSWHDCSAKALRDGYGGYTRKLAQVAAINTCDPSLLEPGNIAVTANGVHVLAYLGNSKWIQADPGAGKVVTSAPNDQGWFESPVVVMEWRQLGE